MRFRDRKAIITGGASGMGRSEGLLFAREGADIAIIDIDSKGAEEVARQVQELGRKALVLIADVADYSQVSKVVNRAIEGFGKVDILVNNAASYDPLVTLAEMTKEQWDKTLDIHVDGTFNCTRCVIGKMIAQRWGRIINISSVVGLTGAEEMVHYSAAKAGIIGFTKALAREVASLGITVNAVAPGVIDTPRLKPYPPGIMEHWVKLTPVGRAGTPEEIAALCAYLASEEASFITGEVVSINGGYYM